MDNTSVASPCVGICELDIETDLCVGCLRTRAEVAVWSSASLEIRQEIVEKVRNRRDAKDRASQ